MMTMAPLVWIPLLKMRWLGLLSLVYSTTTPLILADTNDNNNDFSQEPECHVYMAESTLGVANLGIYTGIPLEKGQILNYPEIVVPLMFREWHNHGGDSLDGTLWDRYIWEGPVVDLEPMTNLLDTDSSKAGFIPGVGCTINSKLDLKNIESTSGSIYDTAGVHRSQHAGAGAFSPYHSSKTVASRYIPAGGEVFAEYGSEWIPDLPGAIVTFDENMDKGDAFLQAYFEWYNTMKDKLPMEVVDGLWNLTTHFPTASQVMDTLPKHKKWSQVVQAMENKQNTNDDDESIVRKFLREQGVRDVEWLKQHGKCQDHLKPGISTLPQAGRGAFASRNLPKGTIVGYSPLIHMGDNRKLWDIRYKDETKVHGKRRKTKYTQQDLILNYSFGHADSTLVLTPYGAMVNFINHSKEKANVKIEWPSVESEAHKPAWLEQDVDFLSLTIDKIGLSFNYVALRNIKEGEEIFLDYGDEWQAAWDDHVKNWKPPLDSEQYMHSTEWTGPLLTPTERETRPYPPNLVTICKESFSYNDATEEYSWTPILRESTHRLYCNVLDRTETNNNNNGEYVYKVEVQYEGDDDSIVVHGVPKEGIELKDKLLSADWHLEHAFRHEIGIPDDMFPESWKNKRDGDNQHGDSSDDDDDDDDEEEETENSGDEL